MNKRKLVIVDLDGTLYQSDDRAHHIEAKDWNAFHQASKDSPPNQDVLDLINMIDQSEADVEFIAITGRNERYRNITLGWMIEHDAPLSHLYMRPDDNYQSDIDVKWSLLEQAMKDLSFGVEDIWFALEDRDKVVDMWREKGINCYQVRPSGY